MRSLTAVEIGADTCALASTYIRKGELHVNVAETLDPAAFPGIDAFSHALRQARKAQKLPRRCRAVVWGLPDGSTRRDPVVAPLVEPLTRAGFKVVRVVTPCNALGALARLRTSRTGGAMCWLGINRNGVAIVVIRPGKLLYSHSFAWDSNVGASGSQARLLQRYSLVAFLAPEVRRAIAAAKQKGTVVDGIVTCGNLPDLRALTMPLIEELDIEVETLDSLEGLVMKPELADKLTEAAPAIRLACAGAFARETRTVDESKRRRVRRTSRAAIALAAAAAIALVAGGGYAWYIHHPTPKPTGQSAANAPAAAPAAGPKSGPSPSATPPAAKPATAVPATGAPQGSAPQSVPQAGNPQGGSPRAGGPNEGTPQRGVPPAGIPPEGGIHGAKSNPPAVGAPAQANANPPAAKKAEPQPPATTPPAGVPPAAATSQRPQPGTIQSGIPSRGVPAGIPPRPGIPPKGENQAASPKGGSNAAGPAAPSLPARQSPVTVSPTPAANAPAGVPQRGVPPRGRSDTASPKGGSYAETARKPEPAAGLNPTAGPADKGDAGPVARGSGKASPEPLKDPVPKVTAILVSADRRLATVGDEGQIIGVGDAIGRRTVVAIDDRTVLFREPSGVQIRVALGGRVVGIERPDR